MNDANEVQVDTRDPWDFEKGRGQIFSKVQGALAGMQPVSHGGYTIGIDTIEPVDIPKYRLSEQKKAIMDHRSLDVPIKGRVYLQDQEGNTIAEKRTTLARVPYLTSRGTFIRNGSAMSLAMQKTRRPGVYVRKTANGHFEGLFKAEDRSGFNVTMDPSTGKMFMKIYKAKIPLYSAMVGMGLSDDEIKEDLGDLYDVNKVGKTTPHIEKMWQKLSKGRVELGEDGYAPSIQRVFDSMHVDPKVTSKTLGHGHDRLSNEVVRKGIRRVIGVHKGTDKSDDMDSLSFQRFSSAEDHFEKFIKSKHRNLMNQLLFKARNTGNLNHLSPNVYGSAIDDVFYKSQLGINLEEINPLESLDLATKVTSMGSGGFTDSHGVPDSARLVHPTQFGMIDTVRSPESGNVGVDTRLAFRTLKGSDGELYHKFVTPAGEDKLVGSTHVDEKVFAFREEYEKAIEDGDKYVPGMRKGRMTYIPLAEVELLLPHAAEMFNYATNMIPANSGVKGMRALMGAKYSVTGDTEVVIKRADDSVWIGPIELYAHREGDTSLCTSNENKEAHWQEVTQRSKHTFSGRLYTIQSGSRTVRVTDHHSMVVIRDGEMIETYPKDMTKGDLLPVMPKYEIPTAQFDCWRPSTTEEAEAIGVIAAYVNTRLAGKVPMFVKRKLQDACATLHDRFSTTLRDDGRVVMHSGLSDALQMIEPTCPTWLLDFDDPTKHSVIKGMVKVIGNRTFSEESLLPIIRPLANSAGLGTVYRDSSVKPYGKRIKFYGKSKVLPTLSDRSVRSYHYDCKAWVKAGISPEPITMIEWVQVTEETVYDLHMQNNVFRTTDGIIVHNTNQALSLRDREAPLVRSELPGDSVYRDFNTLMGERAGAVISKVDGTILSVDDDTVKVIDDQGEHHEYELYNNFPLNRKAYLHNTMLLGVGARVTKGQPIADSNFTKNGVLAQGKNFKVAFLSDRGRTFEDGYSISESAAMSLTSEHMYPIKADLDPSVETGMGKYISLFPATYKRTQLENLDDQGVVKPGTLVHPGDPLILMMKRRKSKGRGMLKTSGGKQWRDDTMEWDHHDKGVVTDVRHSKDGIRVSVKSMSGMNEGDKISGLFGNKGVTAIVRPDNEMPIGADGNPIDIVINKNGVVSRHNPSQVVVESWLGKLAQAQGAPEIVPAFLNGSWVDSTREKLEAAGLSPEETLTTPEGRKLRNVATGVSYLLKLHHTSEAKGSGVGDTGYTMAGTPTTTPGEDKPKRSGTLDTEALIAHGAIEVIKDFKLIKGQDSRSYLNDLMDGKTPKKPKVPAVYRKFIDTLKASGVNVVDNGDNYQLRAMRDVDIDELSAGEVTTSDTVNWKSNYGRDSKGDMDMNPVDGGLFDRTVTGGIGGNRFSHISLPIPLPQPVYEKPIRQMLGLTEKRMNAIIAGTETLGEFGTGSQALREALSSIDVEKSIGRLVDEYKSTISISKKDAIAKQMKALKGVRAQGIKPEDMVVSKVLVIPPKFRPISVNEKFEIIADSNLLYKSLIDARKNYDEIKAELGPNAAGEAAQTLYAAYKAVTGLSDPIRKDQKDQKVKGLLKGIFGPSGNKTGIVQKQLLGTPASYSARGVIVPDPTLNMDQIGIPEDKAWDIFRVPLIRRMIRQTDGSPDAKREVVRSVMKRTPTAKRSLMREMEYRPITYSRAPVLHKYGNIAGYARIVAGDAIHVNPMVEGGLNADHDGDDQINHVFIGLSSDYLLTVLADEHNLESELRKRGIQMVKNCTIMQDYEGVVGVVDLKDFPREDDGYSVDGANGWIDVYSVPSGIEVASYDDRAGKVVWKRVSQFSVHHDRLVEVVSLANGRQIITDDHERAVYGVDPNSSLTPVRMNPSGALEAGLVVPVRVRGESPESKDVSVKVDAYDYNVSVGSNGVDYTAKNTVNDELPLTYESGYFFGAMAGDGWTDAKRSDDGKMFLTGAKHSRITLCNLDDAVVETWVKGANSLLTGTPSVHFMDTSSGSYGKSHVYRMASVALARLCVDAIGKGAENKHIPLWWFNANKEHRFGILAGLLDTDGSVSAVQAKSKKNQQLRVVYHTRSLTLVRDVKLLCESLGIRSAIGHYTGSNTGNDMWQVEINASDCQKVRLHDYLRHETKASTLCTFPKIEDTPASMRHDLVPVTKTLVTALRDEVSALCRKSDPTTELKQLKATLAALSTPARFNGTLSRVVAQRVLRAVQPHSDEFVHWASIVENTCVSWTTVKSVDKTGIRETGYDLSVPGTETFTSFDGVVLSNTFNYNAIISSMAVQDAKDKMLPSRNLRSVADFKLMHTPMQDFRDGIASIGRAKSKGVGRKIQGTPKSRESVMAAYRRGEINLEDQVEV